MVQVNTEDAQTIAEQYRRATEAAPDPGPTKVTRYTKFQPSIRGLAALVPLLPCEGPPLPRFTGLLWPKALRDPIYIYAKKGKPHRQMQLDILPVAIPDIHIYVLPRRLEGDFEFTLDNISDAINIPGGGDIKTTLTTAEENLREKLIDAFEQANEAIRAKASLPYLLKKSIKYTGTWSIVKALWDIFANKRIKVKLDIPTRIAGYETDEYIIDDFAKDFGIDAEVKVDNVHWHAW